MGSNVFANLTVHEGTVSGETTVNLNFRARRLTITNDSSSKNLGFKFSGKETFGTLKPTETVSMEMRSRMVILSGASVPYRVWGIG